MMSIASRAQVNAIESEHSKNLQSDFWRYEQLFKLRADPSHPYAKFGTGNRRTLNDGDDATRDALLAFHGRYYQARSRAVVQRASPLLPASTPRLDAPLAKAPPPVSLPWPRRRRQ